MTNPAAPPPTIYADCFAGISGDMFLGALIDAGLPADHLRRRLALLPLTGYELAIEKKRDQGIAATRVHVKVVASQPARSWPEIRQLIADSGLAALEKDIALRVFTALARAEAAVHGTSEDEVHFHEIGGVDSVVDIVGAAVGISYFGAKSLTASPLPMPRGFVDCAHGRLPLPAPAVCELLKGIGAPVVGVDEEMEMVTPTGAAIVAAQATAFGPMPAMEMEKIGYGAGSRSGLRGRPNLLRLVIGRGDPLQREAREVVVMETNLDDYQPETMPYVTERLLAAGAVDVVFFPVQMKKGRPGLVLQALAPRAAAAAVQRLILTETSAIGLRFRVEQRLTLPRRQARAGTDGGEVRVKIVTTPAGERATPEYEDCARAARASGLPITTIYQQAMENKEE